VSEFENWEDLRAELHDGDDDALAAVSPGRVSQIENGDLDVNEVATLSRYARALGARMRIIFDYGNDLRQIA
jgi:hypothetical protein